MLVTLSLLIAVCFSPAHGSCDCTHPLTPWKAMTLQDLNAIHFQIKENTAAALDEENRDFAEWLEFGYAEAKGMINKVNSFEGYASVLKYYTAGFRDEHIQIGFHVNTVAYRWPQFMISFENGDFVVTIAESEETLLPKVGDRILEIDGIPVQNTLEERVFRFQKGVPSLESDIGRNTPYLLINDGNPFLEEPKTCKISSKGDIQTIHLTWENIDREKALKNIRKARQRTEIENGIRDFLDKKGAWVSLGSFYPQSEEETATLQEIVDTAASLRDRQVIVIDVRGNDGGSSLWGTNLIKALYGKEFSENILDEIYQKERIEFRVSKDNYLHLKNTILSILATIDPDGKEYPVYKKLTEQMEDQLEKGNTSLLRVENTNENQSGKSNSSLNTPKFQGVVIFVTDWSCSSSCLTFATELLRMPNVIHVGKPTHGNSYYLEARTSLLPSKMATIVFPMNIEKNRTRGFNEVYTPEHRYPGNLGDTPALEAWILNLYRGFPLLN